MLEYSDAGFPIVDDTILIGYIASNELEHALNSLHSSDDSTRCYFKESMFDLDSSDKSNNFTAYMDQVSFLYIVFILNFFKQNIKHLIFS